MNEKHIPVCKGAGLYHSGKTEYSKETQKLVKQLLDESKLSIVQKAAIGKLVKNGDPLPDMVIRSDRKVKNIPLKQKLKSFVKRSQFSIIQSGAYEREKYKPVNNKAPSNLEKARLQSLMAYGIDIPINNDDVVRTKKCLDENEEMTTQEIYDGLVSEIEERAQFLEDMKELGEGKKYNLIIKNEIAQKLQQLEMLDRDRFKQETGTVEKYYKKFISLRKPKSLPLTALQFPYQ
ncbi:UPF0193 protein EVG1 homolog [Lycorma delicatula]|uniref:UPF0193 protein EVG1 homolog n=1 Tax=Lycorma delicatula TaxID=130591 RepID=UPI003F510ABF